jgi:Ca2+/H+ antiporter, TMEM165/GDT1 family
VNLAVAVAVFALVFPAELPDKTAVASVVLSTRYRPQPVFAGVAAGFAVHVALAVAAGGLLSLLPRRALEAVVAVLFLAGALLLLRGHAENAQHAAPAGGQPPTAVRAMMTSFLIIVAAEFGDLTQIVMASLAARYHHHLIAVAVGSVLALWAVGALAITGGRGLVRVMPITVIVRLAALAMATLAVISLVTAILG